MEPRARYLLVGVFVLAFAAALVLFTLWIVQIEIVETRPSYRIFFTGNVTGLREGSPVRYRGVPVGKVSDITLNPNDVEQVVILIHVAPGTPVRADTTASLEMRGITGNTFIQLAGGTNEAPPLLPIAGEPPIIETKPSLVAAVMERAPEILMTIDDIGARIARILSPENERLVTEALGNLHSMSANLANAAVNADATMLAIRKNAENIERLVLDIDQQTKTVATAIDATLADVRVTLGALEENSKVGMEDLAQTTAEARRLAQSLRTLSDELGNILEESRLPIRDFTNVGLYELSRMIIEARDLAASMGRVSRQLERSPVDFIFSGAQESQDADAQEPAAPAE